MASPDVSQYVDLTPFDRSVQGIFEAALASAASKLPGWVPREGNTEVVLLEALAVEISELVFAVNRAPAALVEGLLGLYGVERDLGGAASMDIIFTLSDTAGHTVPAGTRVALAVPGISSLITFATDADLVVAPGNNTGVIPSTAETLGTLAHEAAANSALQMIDAISFVESATMDGVAAGGRDAEDDADFLNRAVTRLRALSDVLVRPRHFVAAALATPGVGRAMAVDEYDPGQAGDPGDHAGHLTVVVADAAGGALTSQFRADLEVALEDRAQVNLDVHVVDPTTTVVDVTVVVRRRSGSSSAAVQAAIEDALSTYLSPATWAWSAFVRRNELIALIDGVAGVDYVEDLATPAADVALAGTGPLATAGTLSVTVLEP